MTIQAGNNCSGQISGGNAKYYITQLSMGVNQKSV